jgi:hypothetical protein
VAGKAPAKKALVDFLADFEERLASHPDEAATGAVQVVEERAAGVRRPPADMRATAAAPPPPDAPLPDAPLPDSPLPRSPVPDPPLLGEVVAPTPEATPAPEARIEKVRPEAPVDRAGESRRLRGRRRRKHRHRAQ